MRVWRIRAITSFNHVLSSLAGNRSDVSVRKVNSAVSTAPRSTPSQYAPDFPELTGNSILALSMREVLAMMRTEVPAPKNPSVGWAKPSVYLSIQCRWLKALASSNRFSCFCGSCNKGHQFAAMNSAKGKTLTAMKLRGLEFSSSLNSGAFDVKTRLSTAIFKCAHVDRWAGRRISIGPLCHAQLKSNCIGSPHFAWFGRQFFRTLRPAFVAGGLTGFDVDPVGESGFENTLFTFVPDALWKCAFEFFADVASPNTGFQHGGCLFPSEVGRTTVCVFFLAGGRCDVMPWRTFVLAPADVTDEHYVFFQVLRDRRRGKPGRNLSAVQVRLWALHNECQFQLNQCNEY